MAGKVERAKIIEGVLDETVQIAEISGSEYKTVIASVSKKEYKIVPCSLRKIALLAGLIKEIEKSLSSENTYAVLMAKDQKFVTLMAKVINMAIHPDNGMTIDSILDEFSIADFPKVYQEVLDINDFLAGMGKIYQVAKA